MKHSVAGWLVRVDTPTGPLISLPSSRSHYPVICSAGAQVPEYPFPGLLDCRTQVPDMSAITWLKSHGLCP